MKYFIRKYKGNQLNKEKDIKMKREEDKEINETDEEEKILIINIEEEI